MMRCVMFDFGNVLVHFDTQRWYNFIAAHRHSGTPKPDEFFYFSYTDAHDLGLIDETGYYEAVQRVYELDVDINEFFREFTDIMNPDQEVIRLKQVLKRNGIKLALVSNMNRCHFEYVSQKWPEVFADFNYLALSFQMQARKPDLEMYRVPAFLLDVRPQECLLIDDCETNVSAFQKWGGVGHHYNVVDEEFCPNGKLGLERGRLLFELASFGLISFSQVDEVM